MKTKGLKAANRATHTVIEVLDAAGECVDRIIVNLTEGFRPGDTYRAKIDLQRRYPEHTITAKGYAKNSCPSLVAT